MKYWLGLLLVLLQNWEISNYSIDQKSVDTICSVICSGQESAKSISEQAPRQYWIKDRLEMLSENVANNTAELSNIRKHLNHLSGSDLSNIFRLTRSATFTKNGQENAVPMEDSLIKTLPTCEFDRFLVQIDKFYFFLSFQPVKKFENHWVIILLADITPKFRIL